MEVRTMKRPRSIPKPYWDYILDISQSGPRTVCADDLPIAGWLIEAGYARAEDDYEGPRLYLTPKMLSRIEKAQGTTAPEHG